MVLGVFMLFLRGFCVVALCGGLALRYALWNITDLPGIAVIFLGEINLAVKTVDSMCGCT
jgi:hypothetical protein